MSNTRAPHVYAYNAHDTICTNAKGGYRDSNPGPPEPQSGALTNCAIPTIFTSYGPYGIDMK